VVGVDGSPASRHAVLWAAQEARIRRSYLIITHIDPPTPDAAGLYDGATDCHTVLAASAAAASQREPAVAVGALLLSGAIRDELLKLSKSAVLIVVGVDQTKPRAAFGAIGSIEDRVVVHSSCPVVTVSSPSNPDQNRYRHVVVGWTNDTTGQRALDAAAQEADVRAVTLTVVAVKPSAATSTQSSEVTGQHNDEALVSALAAIEQAYPSLPISCEYSQSDLAQALILKAYSADLLILGCRHSEDRWSIRTGAVAADVMRHAHCPVMLVGNLATTVPSPADRRLPSRDAPPAARSTEP
jgi:nucleotide-binding universal stress UspA family protein